MANNPWDYAVSAPSGLELQASAVAPDFYLGLSPQVCRADTLPNLPSLPREFHTWVELREQGLEGAFIVRALDLRSRFEPHFCHLVAAKLQRSFNSYSVSSSIKWGY